LSLRAIEVRASMAAATSRAAKRALQEQEQFREEPEPGEAFEAGPMDEGRPLIWEAIVRGPKGSPYEGGTFCLEIELSESYPFKPPWFSFQTPIYHCNLGLAVAPRRCPAECLLRWKENWHPKMDVRSVLRRIVELLKKPVPAVDFKVPESPRGEVQEPKARLETSLVDHELATLLLSDRLRYLKLAKESTSKYAALESVQTPGKECDNGEAALAVDELGLRPLQERPQQGDFEAQFATESCEDVDLPCPICGTWYSTELLAVHLEGHFAFEARLLAAPAKPGALSSADAAATSFGTAAAVTAVAALSSSPSSSCAAASAPGAKDEEDEDDWVVLVDGFASVGLGGPFASAEVRRCSSAAASTDLGRCSSSACEDAELAARLQREEIERTLSRYTQLAADRLQAMRLEAMLASEDREQQRLQLEAFSALQQQQQQQKTAASSSSAVGVVAPQSKPKPRPKLAVPRPPPPPPPSRALVSSAEQQVLRFANGKGSNGQLCSEGEEYQAVREYFVKRLGARDVNVRGINRVNAGGGSGFRPGTAQRAMFHGCKCIGNEHDILNDGFKVSKCISGGKSYGTWFAFNAAYSDSGFAFNDLDGIRHLFICLVSNAHVVMETDVMRVVGPGCAFPCWIVRYTHQQSGSLQSFNVGPYGRWGGGPGGRGTAATLAPYGYEVQHGQWVPITKPQSKS